MKSEEDVYIFPPPYESKKMIEYKVGDLLQNVKSGVVMHCVNSRGVMGSGFAKQLKQLYPKAFASYKEAIDAGAGLGHVDYCLIDNLYIVNCFAQKNYGYDGKRYVNYIALAKCLDQLFSDIRELNTKIKTQRYAVHFPTIGAGLAGGDWTIIEQLINDADPSDSVQKICWKLK